MTDPDRSSLLWQYARAYAEEAVPPPAVDVALQARLRMEAEATLRPARRSWSLQTGGWAIAAVAALILLWCGVQLRQEPAERHVVAPYENDQPPVGGVAVPVQENAAAADEDAILAALAAVHADLDAKRFEAAIRRLDANRAALAVDFAEEWAMLYVEALCGSGAVAEARQRATAFSRDYPRSVHAARVSKICRR